jgi:hypothetical protein
MHQPVWFAWLVPAFLLGGFVVGFWTGRFPFMRDQYSREKEPGLYWGSMGFLGALFFASVWVVLTH